MYATKEEDTVQNLGTKLPIPLRPCTRYYWTVQVWGNGGDTAISEINFFETGKRELPLEGSWITTPWENQNISPYIRKEFHVSNIRAGRLYITGLGLYWLEINGKRVGNDYFAPGCTGVNHLVQVYTYDITDLLDPGKNVLGVMMGNGWAKEAGFQTFYVTPEYTDRFSFVHMRYDSPKGTILVKWEKHKGGYQLYVKVPFDTTAIVKLPGLNSEDIRLTAGEHSFTVGKQ